MKTQTAVEKIIYCLEQNQYYIGNDLYEVLKEAIEIEKQQIIEAHGNKAKNSGGVTNYTYILTGEEYYKETFKK